MPKKKKKESKEKKEKKVDPQVLADKALELTLKQINKMGDGPQAIKIGRFGEIKALELQTIPSGSLALDMALGVGGYPLGRIIEMYGQPGSGKSSLCLHAIAEAQKLGHRAAYMDVEHTFSPDWAEALGVDMNNLYVSQPDNGDEAMEIIDLLVKSGAFKIIVIDSVASLVTRAEMEGEITAVHMGRQARLMSQALKRLTVLCGKTDTTLLFTNQIREKMVMYGSPITTPGGNALKFYASQRLEVARKEVIKDKSDIIGMLVRVKVVKNKVGRPFQESFFNFMYDSGIDKEADVIAVAEKLGILERAGAWYSYNGEQLGQGLANTVLILKERPELIAELREKVLKEV